MGDTAAVPSILDMSDEEFLKQGASNVLSSALANLPEPEAKPTSEPSGSGEGAGAASAANATPVSPTGGEGGEGNTTGTDQPGDDQGKGTGDGDGTQTQKPGEGSQADPAAGVADPKQGEQNQDQEPGDGKQNQARGPDGKFVAKDGKDGAGTNTDTTQTKPADGAIDYKVQFERLTAPFKANGRDFRVNDVDEAIQLMQMGAGYNKKMAALKPNLAIIKTLENNGLLDADKINFLIDVSKKNPEAISKLVQESGIDPMDLSAEKAGAYKPGNHKAHESEVELDHVLDEISGSAKYNETLQLVSQQWDARSKQMIANQPQLLKVINGHMESGIYDLVATEVERGRLFGGLAGLSDLEAYRQVGDTMAKDGKFDHLMKQPGQATPSGQQTPVAKTVVNPTPKQADDSKRDAQRRAAAPAKGAAPAAKVNEDVNPLALSDEDFLKSLKR